MEKEKGKKVICATIYLDPRRGDWPPRGGREVFFLWWPRTSMGRPFMVVFSPLVSLHAFFNRLLASELEI